jgi:putative ABC transport system permease protein
LVHDLLYAFRTFRRAPAFALTAIVTFALGIGATTAMFSTVNAALLRPFPYPHAEDLYAISQRFTDGSLTSGLIAPVEFGALNQPGSSVMRAAGAIRLETTFLRDDGTPMLAEVYAASEGFFDIFGLPLTLGHGFAPADHVLQGPGFTVMSYRVWRDVYGSDPQIVGRRVRFSDVTMTVIGVAARDFDVPHATDFWFNARLDPRNLGHGYWSYLRAKPGTRPDRLRADLVTIMAGLIHDMPGSGENGRAFVVEPFASSVVGDLGPILIVVLSGTVLLLVLTCVNVTNLFLARGFARVREMAIRTALGASRARIARQLVTESMVLAAAGAAAGAWLAYAGVRLLLNLGAARLPRLDVVPFDARVWLFAGAVLLITGVLVGLAPSWQLARHDLKGALNEGGRTESKGRGTYRMLAAMVIAEVAVAVTLVAGAGWLTRSYANLYTKSPGFKTDNRLEFELNLPFSRYRPPQVISWSHDLLDHLRKLGSVVSVGSASSFPLRPAIDSTPVVRVIGVPVDPTRPGVVSRMRVVSPGFFHAMGMRMLSGRGFTDDDRATTAPVAIVNETFARRYMPGRNAIQMQLAFGFPAPDLRKPVPIVGLVNDVSHVSVSVDPEPAFYLPLDQSPFWRQAVVVETSLPDATRLVPLIRAEVKRLDPQLPIDPETVRAIVASTMSRQKLGMDLMILFGAIALGLADVGIYGVIAYASSQRTGEVATRLALGASPSSIFWLMLGQGRTLAAAGGVIGLAAAYATGRLASSWLFEVRATDPLILVASLALVLAGALVATVIPARRAARVDPVVALRLD